MMDVLKVFHSTNVQWKRIGPYNMKCLWNPPSSKALNGKFVDQFPQIPQTKPVDGKTEPSTAANGMGIKTHDVVKFELQVRNSFWFSTYVLELEKWKTMRKCSYYLVISLLHNPQGSIVRHVVLDYKSHFMFKQKWL